MSKQVLESQVQFVCLCPRAEQRGWGLSECGSLLLQEGLQRSHLQGIELHSFSAPGIATSNKGIATRSKEATSRNALGY